MTEMSEIPRIKVTVPNAPKMSVGKDSDEWDKQLKLKEDKENKITEIGEASTDEEYPSAGAVVRYTEKKTADYVKNTDYANYQNSGVVKVHNQYGLTMRDGIIGTWLADNGVISSKQDKYRPIVPYTIDTVVSACTIKSIDFCRCFFLYITKNHRLTVMIFKFSFITFFLSRYIYGYVVKYNLERKLIK